MKEGDRAIFGVVISGIRKDLGLTDAQLGLVGSVLFLTLALMMPLAGIVGDKLRKNWIITCSLFFWSTATLFTGCVQGILGLILLRSVATAGGEAFYAPAAYPLMAKFHQRTRALALSLHQGALYVGVMTSGFLGGWIAQQWGWRSAFYAFGGCGILLGLVFVFRLKDSPDPAAGRRGRTAGVRGRNLQALGIIFRIPTALMLAMGLTAIVFVNNGFIVWAPEFLREKQQDLSLALAGGYSMFWHHLPALIGISLGGPLSDWLVLRRPTARLELQAVAMALGVPSIVLMALAPEPDGGLPRPGAVRLVPRAVRVQHARGAVRRDRAPLPRFGGGHHRHDRVSGRLDLAVAAGTMPRMVRRRATACPMVSRVCRWPI